MFPVLLRKKGSQNTARRKDDDVIETKSFYTQMTGKQNDL